MAHSGHDPVTGPTASLACRAIAGVVTSDVLPENPSISRATHLFGGKDRITGRSTVLRVAMGTEQGGGEDRLHPRPGVYFPAWGASVSARDRATPKRSTCLGGRTGSADPRGRSIGGASAPGE